MSTTPDCVFCEIVAGSSPAKVRYLDDEVICIVNRLTWVPLMLLVMPKKHMGQIEMWTNGTIAKLGDVAVEMGATFSPGGFRVLSNFGRDGLQSQAHGHIHVICGVRLDQYA